MTYDFDKIYERRQTNSLKWDFKQKIFGREDVIPLWVADMDFRAPEEVVEALVKRAQDGIYGYSEGPDTYYDSFIRWLRDRHQWEIQKEWIIYSPGVVPALHGLVQALTQPEDRILIQSPVYPPFFQVIQNHGRQVVNSPLKLENRVYTMDFEDLEQKLASGIKMLILCNPHNPVGRVWKREELETLGQLCLDHDVLVVSDEIHSDLIYEGYKHIPFATLSDDLAKRTIVCTAPSKTFNLAGLQTSSIIIPNPKLRGAFREFQTLNGISHPNVFGMVAQEVAYRHGREWLEQLLVYLRGNKDFLNDFLKRKLPQIQMIEPEGTYLVWLDFRALGLDGKALQRFLVHEAGVGLNAGYTFGPGGEGFARLNLACPRSVLKEGLERIEKAVQTRRG